MQRGDDLAAVTEAVGTCLDAARVPYHVSGVNFVHEVDQLPQVTQVLRTSRGAKAIYVKSLRPDSPVTHAWQQQVVVYRRDLFH